MNTRRFLPLLLLLATAAAAAPDAAAPPAHPGGRIVFALKGDAVKLNPVLASDQLTSTVTDLLFDALLQREKAIGKIGDEYNHELVPKLAESYTESLLVRFHTRDATGETDLTADRAVALIEERRRSDKSGALADIEFVKPAEPGIFLVKSRRMDLALPDVVSRLFGRTLACELKPVVVFTLRPDARWHDGEPVTAEDVQFTYDRIMDPQTQSSFRSNFEPVESVEVLDARTVKATYSNYFAKYLETWVTGILPKHILAGENINDSLFNRCPIGSGPFKLKEWAINDYLILTANEQYYGGRPNLDQVVFRIIPDESHMFLELFAGHIDVMQMKPDQFRKATNNPMFEAAFTKAVALQPEYTYIGYNLAREPFDDPRVRRAFTLAIDRERIVHEIMLDCGEVISGPFYKRDWAYNPDVPPLPFDPAAARKLLAEAGWKDLNGDGFLEKDMGDHHLELSFALMTNVGNKDRELTLEVVAEELARIGVRVRPVFEEWGKFIGRIDATDFDAISLAWGLSFDPDDTFSVWNSEEIPDLAKGKYGLNAISYRNPGVDRLFKAGRIARTREERRRCYYEIHRIIAEEQPYTFLYSAQSLYAISRRVHDAQINEIRLTYHLPSWWVDR